MNQHFDKNRRLALAGISSLALTSMAAPTWAQVPGAWPQRPVKWIVSQPAGAGPDILARVIADQLSRIWGQTVIVENRPGGQNVIGAQAAARAASDGYTFFYATTAAMVTNVFTFKALPYDPEKDFVPVGLVGRTPFVLAASTASGIKTLADAIKLAKEHPDKVAIATEGPKTFSGMLADSVASMAGIKLIHVPYNKAPDAIQDVLGGRVQLVCLPDAALVAYIRSGQLQALAVSTAERVASLPSTPPLSDTFKGFEYTGWNGLFAPTGTPPDIVARVNRDMATLLRQPELVQRLQTLGSMADGSMNPAAFAAFMRSERERWTGIIKAIGIVPE